MKDNYPMLTQSEERRAPWNQKSTTPIQADCTVCYCLSKSMPVMITSCSEEDPNFNDTNLIEEFIHDDHAIGLPTLLRELQKLSKEKINKLEDEFNLTSYHQTRNKIRKEYEHYKSILKASKDWVVDDLDVVKDE